MLFLLVGSRKPGTGPVVFSRHYRKIVMRGLKEGDFVIVKANDGEVTFMGKDEDCEFVLPHECSLIAEHVEASGSRVFVELFNDGTS